MSNKTFKKDASQDEDASASPSPISSNSRSAVMFTPEETPVRTPALTIPSTSNGATLPTFTNFPAALAPSMPAQDITPSCQDPQFSPPQEAYGWTQHTSAYERPSALPGVAPDSTDRMSRDLTLETWPTALLAQLSLSRTTEPSSRSQALALTTSQVPIARVTYSYDTHPGMYMNPSFHQSNYWPYPGAFTSSGGNLGQAIYPHDAHPSMYMNPSFHQSSYGPYPGAFINSGGNPGQASFGPPGVQSVVGVSRQSTYQEMYMNHGFNQSTYGAYPSAFPDAGGHTGELEFGPPSVRGTLGDGNSRQLSSSTTRNSHGVSMNHGYNHNTYGAYPGALFDAGGRTGQLEFGPPSPSVRGTPVVANSTQQNSSTTENVNELHAAPTTFSATSSRATLSSATQGNSVSVGRGNSIPGVYRGEVWVRDIGFSNGESGGARQSQKENEEEDEEEEEGEDGDEEKRE